MYQQNWPRSGTMQALVHHRSVSAWWFSRGWVLSEATAMWMMQGSVCQVLTWSCCTLCCTTKGGGYWGWVSDAYRGAFEEICSTFLSPSMWKNKSRALPCHHGIRPMEDLCQMLVLKSSHITESWSSYRLCRAACFFTVWEPECMCCLMWRSTPCPSGVGELVLLPVIHSE